MGDIFDQLESNYQGGAKGDAFDAMEANYQANRPTQDANALAGQIGKGLTFGWFDELQGLDKGAENVFADLFGLGNGKSFGENYQNTVNAARAMDANFEKKHALESLGLQLTGAALPALLTGGSSLATGADLEASGLAGSALKNLYGVGIEGAPTVAELAKMGATSGALAGAGNADNNRLMGAGIGAGVGSIATPVVGKALEYGIGAGANKLLDAGFDIRDWIPRSLGRVAESGERGSIIDTPVVSGAATDGGGYTPEQILLAKELKNTPIDQVRSAAAELGRTSTAGAPLFTPEALPDLFDNARYIANFKPSAPFSRGAINARTEGAVGRGLKLLDIISPQNDAYAGANAFVQGARDITGALETPNDRAMKLLDAISPESDSYTGARALIQGAQDILSGHETPLDRAANLLGGISPEENSFAGAKAMSTGAQDILGQYEKRLKDNALLNYGRAYQQIPIIEDPALKGLFADDQELSSALNHVNRTAINKNMPDDSSRKLIKVRQELDDRIESAIANKNGRLVRDLTDTRGRLNDILQQYEPIAGADQSFARDMEPIEQLRESPVGALANLTDDKIENIDQVFRNLPAAKLADLRQTFVNHGQEDAWNAGARSFLQRTMRSVGDGRDFTTAIRGNPELQDSLNAILGPNFGPFNQGMAAESQRFRQYDPLSKLASLTNSNPENLDSILSGLPAPKIAELRQRFIDSGQGDAWSAGVRSFLQRTIRGARDGQDFTTAIRGNPELQDSLNAMLGPKFGDFDQGLALENQRFKQYDPLSAIAGLGDKNPENLDSILPNLPTAKIAELREAFINNGKGAEWDAGVRSYLQRVIRGTGEGRNFTTPIRGNGELRDTLGAMLGPNFSPVEEGLALENRMFQGKNLYNRGSSTHGNFAEEENFNNAMGALSLLKNGDWKGAIGQLFQTSMPDETALGLAKIYFDPKTGQSSVEKIIPLLEAYAKNKAIAGLASRIGSNPIREAAPSIMDIFSAANKPGPSLPTDIFTPIKKPPGKSSVVDQIKADPYYSAVMQAESGGNLKAQNPDSSAKGPFQFTDATAKALGVKDPTNLAQAFNGMKKLTAMNDSVAKGDPYLRYAAHYMGAPLLQKVLNKGTLSPGEESIVQDFVDTALPRFKKIYDGQG